MEKTDLDAYDYILPPELIRRVGIEPRDQARLLIYETATDTVTFDVFCNLAQYVPAKSLCVLNDTRVMPVRLWLTKETGGKIEVFVLIDQLVSEERIPVLVDRKIAVGQRLSFPDGQAFEVVAQEEQLFFLRLISTDDTGAPPLLELLCQYGQTPLPHYLEGAAVNEAVLRERYQTVFAKLGASVAAPTAGLHFTEATFASLAEKEIERVTVTLNVGRGTFAPLTAEHLATKTLHTEFLTVTEAAADRLNQAQASGQPILTVGTTALRTLESTYAQGLFHPYSGPTNIFLFPPHHFETTNMLLTNFHLPKTSLMLLVDAFLEDKRAKRRIVELYRLAIENQFSFYSFGDSMLIL